MDWLQSGKEDANTNCRRSSGSQRDKFNTRAKSEFSDHYNLDTDDGEAECVSVGCQRMEPKRHSVIDGGRV